MLKNRVFSFLIILFVYILATIGAFLVYPKIPYSYPIALLIADIFATVIVFAFSLVFENASVYDPYWSVQPIVIVCAFAIKYEIDIMGILILIAIGYWGLRLTANWAYTFQNLTCQDWRYTMLKDKTKKGYPLINFAGIHLVPTLIVYSCTLPAVIAINEYAQFKPVCGVFFGISILAATIQLIADIQMHSFRKDRATGKTDQVFIRRGLWKKGRHPNYLGEILMWWGIGGACVCAMPDRWYLLAGALANTVLFCCASIPMAERRQSRKSGFDTYKKETRILI